MASNYHRVLVTLSIAAILFPTIAMAAEHVVGDDKGWTINFDYQAWAKDKVFRVGDKLGITYIHILMCLFITYIYIHQLYKF